MKLRHAAALALVGWFFVLPPTRFQRLPSGKTAVHMNPKAPLSRWQILGRFDSTEECYEYSNELRKVQHETDPPSISAVEEQDEETTMNVYLAKSQCIVTDDPRLKGNKDLRDFNRN